MQHCFNDSPLTILLHRPRSPRDDAIARPQLWQGFQQWHWLFEVHLAVSFDGGRRWRCRWLGSHVLLDSISDHLYAWVRVEGVGSEICQCRVLWFGVRCQGLRGKKLWMFVKHPNLEAGQAWISPWQTGHILSLNTMHGSHFQKSPNHQLTILCIMLHVTSYLLGQHAFQHISCHAKTYLILVTNWNLTWQKMESIFCRCFKY